MSGAWARAASFAARAHAGQVRKDGRTPYVAHPFRVALTVRHVFGCDDETALVAALLHDTIEDTTTDFDEIEAHFGRDVAEIVARLTKNSALPEAEREAEYDARLAAGDWRAKLIKLADVFDNIGDGAGQPPAARRKVLAKARRAIAIARAGATAEPVLAGAIRHVEGLIRKASVRR